MRMLTTRSAEVFGIRDRGRLEVGMAADLVVFDPDRVGSGPLRRVHDLPGGADRLVSEAFGIEAVVVNGDPIRENGADLVTADSSLPGRVLRKGVAG